jgi:hypothetical protein
LLCFHDEPTVEPTTTGPYLLATGIIEIPLMGKLYSVALSFALELGLFTYSRQPRAFSVNVERVRTEAVAVAPEIGIARVLISIDIVPIHARL